ncbi:MAG TPA: hypothetical protein VM287_09880 [Egibacteraceae bacterium]|nr:hypothetical protein [Egibacteraceae bacterium]
MSWEGLNDRAGLSMPITVARKEGPVACHGPPAPAEDRHGVFFVTQYRVSLIDLFIDAVAGGPRTMNFENPWL